MVALPPAVRPAGVDEGTSATPVAAVRASSSVLRGMRPSAQGLIPAGLDQLSPLLVGAEEQARPATRSVTQAGGCARAVCGLFGGVCFLWWGGCGSYLIISVTYMSH